MVEKTQEYPVEVHRKGSEGLLVVWTNGEKTEISSTKLRQHCPCATCKEKQGDTSHAKPLSGKKSLLNIIEHTLSEELNLTKVRPIGNYALGLEWADGHSTGIYTYDLLWHLAGKGITEKSDSRNK